MYWMSAITSKMTIWYFDICKVLIWRFGETVPLIVISKKVCCSCLLNYNEVLRIGCTVSHGVSEMCFSIKVKCRRVVDMTLTCIRYLRVKEFFMFLNPQLVFWGCCLGFLLKYTITRASLYNNKLQWKLSLMTFDVLPLGSFLPRPRDNWSK